MRLRACSSALATAALTVGLTAAAPPAGAADPRPFLDRLNTVSLVASTVPENGDVNPYGTFTIRENAGDLHRGNVLVSNFNNSATPANPSGQQGRGTTLVQITPGGTRTTFATIDPNNLPGECPGGVGLTTALTVLPGGWVVVGSLPTTDGTSTTAKAGCLLVLDKHGTVRETIAHNGINGPWDMTAVSFGKRSELFVTNVLIGTVDGGGGEVDQGTVLRITLCTEGDQPPVPEAFTVIGDGFPERTDPSALVVGPTGVGLGHDGTLFVADTVLSRITAIPHAITRKDSAGIGRVISSGGNLNGPLGMAITPRGDILTVNGGDGNIVETTPAGRQVAKQINNEGTPPGAGSLFGLALDLDHDAVYFVNNADNVLDVLH